MGVIAGANLNDNGLVFSLDAANFRSYSGSGLTSFGLVGGIGGTLVNGVGFTSTNGGSFFFDGTNDYLVTSAINLSSANNITVLFWTKIVNYREVSLNSNCILEFSSNYNNTTGGFNISFGDDSSVAFGGVYPITLAVKGNTNYNFATFSKTLVNDLAWHHWTCILDKSQSGLEVSLYIDGVLRSPLITSIADNTNNFDNTNLYVANRSFSNINLSNLQIYNRALTAQEIKQNYNATKKRYGL
jgi:hypothetical protein